MDSIEDIQVILARRRDVAANSAEDSAAIGTSKTTRYLLLELRHPYVALALIVIEGNPRMDQECQDLVFEISKTIEQVFGFRLFGATPFFLFWLLFRGRKILGKSLLD